MTLPLPFRRGPRPLVAHLHLAMNCWLAAPHLYALRAGMGRLPADFPTLPEAETRQEMAFAIEAETRRRMDRFLRGIELYRQHPYRRTLPDPPVSAEWGSARLLDYRTSGTGRVCLAVPSLVNRAYILDLSARRSLMRHLAGQDLRPFLLDWGSPQVEECHFGISTYIRQRLLPAIDHIEQETGEAPVLIGYCMGGLLALAAARERAIAGLALLATPWDFTESHNRLWLETALAAEPLFSASSLFPLDLIQMFFASLDPMQVARKFLCFAEMDQNSTAAQDFVALEDWLNDGVPLALPAAMECCRGFYQDNLTARLQWPVLNKPLDPADITCPTLVLSPQQDRIVPHHSAAALAKVLPHATHISPDLGHIGMIVSRHAPQQVWQKLVAWIKS